MENIRRELAEYREQLAQVEQVLAIEPGNKESLQLRVKLQELIDLYTQLLGADEDEGHTESNGSAEVQESGNLGKLGASNIHRSSFTPGESTSASSGRSGSGSFVYDYSIGTVCEFSAPDGQWYPVCVIGVADEAKDLRNVHFFGFGNEKTVKVDLLRNIAPLDAGFARPATVKDGLECEAKYYADGKWYAVRIQKVIQDDLIGNSIEVLFTKYGNVEIVPLSYLRVQGSTNMKRADGVTNDTSMPSSAVSGENDKKRSSSSLSGPPQKRPKILPIPSKLKFQEGDTDKERDAKRKRLRAIKSKNRFARMEIESMEKQSSWQSFQKKKTKKLVRKGYSSTSIFASSSKKVGHGATGRR